MTDALEALYGTTPEPTCDICGDPASANPECRTLAEQEGVSSAQIAREDGTYNPDTNRYRCTGCYIASGMPSSREGWKAG